MSIEQLRNQQEILSSIIKILKKSKEENDIDEDTLSRINEAIGHIEGAIVQTENKIEEIYQDISQEDSDDRERRHRRISNPWFFNFL